MYMSPTLTVLTYNSKRYGTQIVGSRLLGLMMAEPSAFSIYSLASQTHQLPGHALSSSYDFMWTLARRVKALVPR